MSIATDWIVIGAGLLSVAILSAPIWLAPLFARWGQDEGIRDRWE